MGSWSRRRMGVRSGGEAKRKRKGLATPRKGRPRMARRRKLEEVAERKLLGEPEGEAGQQAGEQGRQEDGQVKEGVGSPSCQRMCLDFLSQGIR